METRVCNSREIFKDCGFQGSSYVSANTSSAVSFSLSNLYPLISTSAFGTVELFVEQRQNVIRRLIWGIECPKNMKCIFRYYICYLLNDKDVLLVIFCLLPLDSRLSRLAKSSLSAIVIVARIFLLIHLEYEPAVKRNPRLRFKSHLRFINYTFCNL